jgi:hypothetical protein
MMRYGGEGCQTGEEGRNGVFAAYTVYRYSLRSKASAVNIISSQQFQERKLSSTIFLTNKNKNE